MQASEFFLLKVKHLNGIRLLLGLFSQVFLVLRCDLHDFLDLRRVVLNSAIQIVFFSLEEVHFSGLDLIDHDG